MSPGDGSSPLARGLPRPGRPIRTAPGIIPARAGFTDHQTPGRRTPRDHPRSRGVYVRLRRVRESTRGSSPLARGLRGRAPVVLVLRRIIPARAGFTSPLTRSPTRRGDHPRSRGVYLTASSRSLVVMGSSPLARGLLYAEPDGGTTIGIIPARAGFTLPPFPAVGRVGDHPRSRGVYVVAGQEFLQRDGSSPLARGLRTGHVVRRNGKRIIPARAGFTAG